MVKQFNDFEKAFEWGGKVLKNGLEISKEVIAEQVYKDSNEFTYRESGDMYKSGELYSNFKEGVIIERTPYVRRRYYEGGNAGSENKKAQPRWFDKTVFKYKKNYLNMLAKELVNAKREV